MFDKVKELNKLRKTQSEIKKQLEQIQTSEEKGEYRVVVRGDKKVMSVEIDGEENKVLKSLLNDAFKKVEKKSEKQLRGQLSDLGFPGL